MKEDSGFDSKKLINDVKALFEAFPKAEANYRQVAAELGIEDKKIKELVKGVLSQLLNTHFLLSDKRGKYRLNPKQVAKSITNKQYITGVVDMKQTGKAYVICAEMNQDVLIMANNTGKALDGDTVKVLLFPCRKGKKQEGQVVDVVKRAKTQFVGRLQISSKCAFVIPDAGSMPVDIFIPMELVNGAKDGDKVVAKLTEWHERSRNPFGEIVHVLGKPGENNVEMQSILIEYDFPLSFSPEAEAEAGKVSDKVTKEDLNIRRDFRDIFTLTIDPADAKDFDDAISYRVLSNGNVEVGVHIADVSHYVVPGSAIDKEAYERATSVYLVDRVIPMLPEKLSNFVCSLRPNEEKLCFSAVFEMNAKGDVLGRWFGRTVIESDVRFAYEEAQSVIEGGDSKYKTEILQLWALASKLRERRFKKGAIDFESQEVKFKLDENGKPIGVYIKESKEANHLIEEFMLLANMSVAEHVGKVKSKETAKTFVYRIHDQPNPEKITQFSEFVKKLGYKIKMNDRASLVTSMNKLFKDVAGKGEENMINQIAVRTMSKAVYSTDNIGHYGLAFDFYTHFTSPIRRYPDLMVHRLLAQYLDNKPSADKEFYETCCVHSSTMEKKAADAERSSVKLKQAEYLIDHIGDTFQGVISGVSKWGIYVELNDNKCEGMVKLRDLQDDFYYLDEENYQVIGQRYGNKYKLGDHMQIKVKGVDLQRKQIDFSF